MSLFTIMQALSTVRDFFNFPRTMLFLLLLSMTIQLIPDVFQYFYFVDIISNKKDTKIVQTYVLEAKVDEMRIELISIFLDLFVYTLELILLKNFWEISSHNNFICLAFLTVYKLLLHDMPLILFQYCIQRKYNGENEPLSDIAFQAVKITIGSYIQYSILLLILKGVAFCSYLDYDESEENNQPSLDPNAPPPEPINHGCCFGKFWLFIYIIYTSILVIAGLYSGELYMQYFGEFTQGTKDPFYKEVSDLISTLKFDPNSVFIQEEGSPNAMVVGCINSKMIIIRSLIKHLIPEQVRGVVGHELGHWKHYHLWFNVFFIFAMATFIGLMLRYLTKGGLSSIGFENKKPIIVIMAVLIIFSVSIVTIFSPIINIFGRVFENDADCFAAKLNLPIGESLTSLISQFKEIESHPVYVFFKENHPNLKDRLKNIEKCKAK